MIRTLILKLGCPCHDKCSWGCPCGFYQCAPSSTCDTLPENKEPFELCGAECIYLADEIVAKLRWPKFNSHVGGWSLLNSYSIKLSVWESITEISLRKLNKKTSYEAYSRDHLSAWPISYPSSVIANIKMVWIFRFQILYIVLVIQNLVYGFRCWNRRLLL